MLDSRLTLSPRVAFRVVSAETIEILPDPVGLGRQGLVTAPRGHQEVLAAFLEPRTVGDVSAAIGKPVDAVREVVARYVDLRILQTDEAMDSPGLRAFLREDVFADPHLYAAIKAEISAGRACIVRNAFREDFAERVWRALDAFDGWDAIRVLKPPFLAASALAILDRAKFPPELFECERLLGAAATRTLLSDLGGHPCDGEVVVDPKLYLAGDYFTPHSDVHENRTVSFVWILAKDWQPRWGGHFVWCAPPAIIAPTFNTLLLYRSTTAGVHMVTPVSSQARAKRFTVSAWWISRTATGEGHQTGSDWYRGAVAPLAPNVFTIR